MDRPLRVLLVEDSEDDAQLIIRILKKGGFDPLFERVETAEAMLKALKEKAWDIIFCDYAMPLFGGLKALAIWKETAPDLPLIILSGVIGEETAVECMRLGAQDYIMKGNLSRLVPVVERELVEAVERRQKKLTEQDLWESEERFRQVSQAIFGFVFSCLKRGDTPHRIDWITGAVEKITGYTPEEVLNWGSWKKMIMKEDQPFFEDRIGGLGVGLVDVLDIRIRHKDGGLRWLKVYAKNIRDYKDPTLLRLYGACQDITEEKRLEEAFLKRNEEVMLINNFIRGVSSTLSLETISTFALKEMLRAVKADITFLFSLQGERLDLINIEPETGRDWLGFSPEHRLGKCLCGLAVSQRESIYARDIGSDPRYTMEECLKAGLRSLAVLPLKKGDEILGVIGLGSREERDFEEHRELLETLAAPITVSLQNAKLYEEAKRGKEALLKSEAKYRRLHDSMRDAFVSVDMTGRIQDFNQAYAELLGYSTEELKRLTYIDLTPERWHIFEAEVVRNQILKNGYSDIYEKEYRRKDGSIFPVELRTFLIRENGGEPIGMWAIVRDISERKKIETERLRLTLAIEQSADTVVITDSRGTIQYVNPAFSAITGYSREEVVGQNPRILKSGIQDETVYRDLWQTITEGRTWQGRLINRKKDGTLYTEDVTISPVFDDSGLIINYVAVKRDITEHLLLFEEKEKIQNQFLQAQKMESVGRLAGGVAHDFNNMLSVIMGQSELAMQQTNVSEPMRNALQEIHKAAQRSADLTRQLLAFARKQTIIPQVLDLNDTVGGMLKMLRRLIGEDIQLVWMPGADLWPIKIDPSQVDQILANLTVNARDAISGVGKITIETENISVDQTNGPEHSGVSPGDYVSMRIIDDGCGMDNDILGNLFEPFFTTKEVGKGTGLGLATVYGIVKQNNGFINVSSDPGKGTTLILYFPRLNEEISETEQKKAMDPLPGRGETILLVDDEPSILLMGEVMLTRLGYTVITASNAAQALRLAQDRTPDISLLLTDVVLPQINGRELAERVKEINPEIKCLFMSGYTNEMVTHRGVMPEGIQFIQKPFTLNDLSFKIREVLREGKAAVPNLE